MTNLTESFRDIFKLRSLYKRKSKLEEKHEQHSMFHITHVEELFSFTEGILARRWVGHSLVSFHIRRIGPPQLHPFALLVHRDGFSAHLYPHAHSLVDDANTPQVSVNWAIRWNHLVSDGLSIDQNSWGKQQQFRDSLQWVWLRCRVYVWNKNK